MLIADRAGERLDVFLARWLADCSRAAAQRLIEGGVVAVEGRIIQRMSYRLSAGANVTVHIPQAKPSALVPEPMALDVVYEDGDLLVLNKLSGVVVHPSAGHDAGTLVHGLLAYSQDLSGIGGERRPGIVHRLDRDTSGLLLVAKNDRAHAALSRQLQQHTTGKYYLALLHGVPKPAAGIVDAPLGRDPLNRQKMAVLPRGKPARTRYQSLADVGGMALAVAGLETGRTHQLRVHFAAIGCPIVGDPIYGRPGGPAGRLWLHAWRLGFDRPSDGLRIVLEAPLPAVLVGSWPPAAAGPNAPAAALARLLERARRWAVDPPPQSPAV